MQGSYIRNILFFTGFHLLLVVGVFFFPPLGFNGFEDRIIPYLLKIWGFAIYPLSFFSLTVAVCQLKRKRLFRKMNVKLCALTLLFYLVALLTANVVEVLFPLGKIPIIQLEVTEPEWTFSWSGLLDNVIAPTRFLPLHEGAGSFLTVLLLGAILGLVLARDREVSAPTYNLCDSLSRLAYVVNGFLVFLLPLPLAMITLFVVRDLFYLPLDTYLMPLLLLLLTTFVLFVLLPLLTRWIRKEARPYRHIFYNIRPLMVALVSGETALMLSSLIHDQHEGADLPRSQNGWSTPLLFLFGRVGSAVMLMLAFSVLYASQNRWPMAIPEILYWRLVLPLGFAMLLSLNNFGGVAVMIVLMLNAYGERLSNGYALLLPLIPLVQRLAAVLDALALILLNRLLEKPEK